MNVTIQVQMRDPDENVLHLDCINTTILVGGGVVHFAGYCHWRKLRRVHETARYYFLLPHVNL